MPPSTQTPDSRLQKRQKELDDATLKLLTTSNNVYALSLLGYHNLAERRHTFPRSGLAIREWKDSLDALSTVGPSMVHLSLHSRLELFSTGYSTRYTGN
jgi:hypothetical protein